LWIRSLDADTARPLLGTVGASQPFWSPDSRSVAFFAGNHLKKVDVTSGEVQTLSGDAAGAAGTWSRGGVILFKSDVTGRIERVSADGGTTSPVAAVDSSRGEFWLNWPQFLPDGRRFLYLVRSTQPEYNGVFLASLDGPERTRVLSDESQAIYASPGYLLFHRDATLFAQRFDPASLEKTGAALPLVENVQVNMGTRRGVFSVSDTGVLTYRSAEDSVLSWFDHVGTVLSTVASGSQYRDPAISPDGRTIAVAKLDRRVGNYDIWLIDASGASARPFTFDPGRDLAPVWSPDGARIAFVSRRGEKEEIYVKSSIGAAAEELLYRATGPARPFDWSRDGRFVVFGQYSVQQHLDLWALPFQPGHRPFGVLETPAIEAQAQLSPDGRWLAYDSNEEGALQVFVRPFPNTGAQTWKISDRGGLEPKWRRDGKELFYLGADRRLMAVTVRTAPTFEHDTPRALFETGAAGSRLGTVAGRNQYDVAPDGKRFLINMPGRESSRPITVVLNWPAMLSR
jgi:Tol biopolymer transport system component